MSRATESRPESENKKLSGSKSKDQVNELGLLGNEQLRRENLELKEENKKLKDLVAFLQEENSKLHIQLKTSVENNESSFFHPGKNY